MLKRVVAIGTLMLAGVGAVAGAQSVVSVDPVPLLGRVVADFTLPSVQGPTVTLSGLKGKNVLIVFPRGKVGDHWCQICHYQYAELADAEQRLKFRQKFNMEVLFVLPYNRATVTEWAAKFRDQMAVIAAWKTASGGPRQRQFAEMVSRALPKSFVFGDGPAPTPFPILIDADRALSTAVQLFTTEWDSSYVEQNRPAVLLLDAEGRLLFKYVSQVTWDRPDFDYLYRLFERMISPGTSASVK